MLLICIKLTAFLIVCSSCATNSKARKLCCLLDMKHIELLQPPFLILCGLVYFTFFEIKEGTSLYSPEMNVYFSLTFLCIIMLVFFLRLFTWNMLVWSFKISQEFIQVLSTFIKSLKYLTKHLHFAEIVNILVFAYSCKSGIILHDIAHRHFNSCEIAHVNFVFCYWK